MAIRSDGVCLDDDLCHFQIARAGWHDAGMLINVWGRPGCTLPYALVADIGSTAAGFRASRALTSAMYVAAVWLTWLTARRMRTPHAWLVPVIMLLMPEGFSESFTPCTEIPAALYAIAGTYFLARGRRWWAATFFALLPGTRHELVPFLIPLGLYFLWRRDLVAALLLGWFELAWAGASWWLGAGQPLRRYFTPGDSSLYGSGNLLHYFFNWLKMAGIPIVALTLTGATVLFLHEWRAAGTGRWKRRTMPGRRARLRVLVVGGATGLVALETVLYTFNRFASGGYSTFLVPAAPFMAICGCYGINPLLRVWRGNARRRAVISATHAAILIALIVGLVQWGRIAHPLRMGAHESLIGRTIARLRHDHPDCHIVGHSAWITYFDEISPGARDLPGIQVWKANQVKELYYLYDPAPGFSPPIEEITCRPHEVVETLKRSPSDVEPDLVVYRRLPDVAG